MQFEKKYWSKNEYTDYQGNNFTGYVGIYNGKPYDFISYKELTSKNAYITRINCSDKNFDRTLSQKLQLPYGRRDIVFAANDFMHNGLIDTIVSRLQENNDYIFQNSIISNANLPITDECLMLSSLTDAKGNLKENGILGKYNFSSYAFNSKTHNDTSFYPDTKVVSQYFSKSKSNNKKEEIDIETAFIKGDKVSKTLELDCSIQEKWRILNNNGEPLKYGDIDLDIPGIVTEQELKYFDNIEDINDSKHDLIDKKVYSYNTLEGPYVETKVLNPIITIDAKILKNTAEPEISDLELKFLMLLANEPAPDLSINDIPSSKKTYRVNDEWSMVTYNFDGCVFNSKELQLDFQYPTITIGENDNIRFDSKFKTGNIEKYEDFNLIPSIERITNYSYVWVTGNDDNLSYHYSQKNCTYQFLTGSDEWTNAKAKNLNPRLIMLTDKRGVDYTPQDTMTAYDVYVQAANNFGLYDYPAIYRSVTYKDNGLKANPNYRKSIYSINSYAIDEELEEVVASYKLPEDVYNDLYELNEVDKYDSIPKVIKESVSVEADNENLLHNFNDITAADIVIHSIDKDNRKAVLLVFLMFKNKVVIFKTDYFYKNSNISTDEVLNYIQKESDFENKKFQIDLNDGKDAIVIENIDPLDNLSLKFTSLNAIKVYKNTLYLIDNKLDMVLRYDIDYLISSDEAKTENWFDKRSIKLIDSLQGFGSSTDKIYFNNPYSIDVCDDYVYIVDRGNNCVKQYTNTLNFVKVLKNGFFSSHDIQAVKVNPYPCKINGTDIAHNSIWIVSAVNKRIYISVLEEDEVKFYGQVENVMFIENSDSWTEEVRAIEFSEANSNYFYLNTSKRIYKFHVSNPLYPYASLSYFKQRSIVGNMRWSAMRYPWHKTPSIYGSIVKGSEENVKNEITWDYEPPTTAAEILDNKCFAVSGHPEIEGDIIFHFGVLYDNTMIKNYIRDNKENYENNEMTFDNIPSGELANMIKSSSMLLYNEPDSFISTISNPLVKIFDIEESATNVKDEYINHLTINKFLRVLVYNLLQIKNTLIGHFRAATNIDNIITYDNIILDDYFNNLQLDSHENYFVHSNEHFSIILNRAFENVYDIQEKMLNKIQTEFMAAPSYVNNASRLI